jgi:tRNA A-37 threonylcarbamoyl transferase component Bud32
MGIQHPGMPDQHRHLIAPELPARYESIRLLGNGGMASVWCAQDTVLRRRVAIKLLAESFAGEEEARRRFMREARAAARLSGHPNVVTIFDVGDCDGRPYIVMEHVAGGTVADAIRLSAHSRREALAWIEQAAAALDHAHAHGVVHRDVKPANMLLGTDRVLRLADFGIASLATEQTLSSGAQLFATAAYISPEQALGWPASAASDRYALAVAAFELLTGERPFGGTTVAAQARAHIELQPPRASERAPELSGAVDTVLARGMAKSPERRWASAREFAAALREAVERGARIPRRAAATRTKPVAGAVCAPSAGAPRPAPALQESAAAPETAPLHAVALALGADPPPLWRPKRRARHPIRARLAAAAALAAAAGLVVLAVALVLAQTAPAPARPQIAASRPHRAARERSGSVTRVPRRRAYRSAAASRRRRERSGAAHRQTRSAALAARLEARGHELMLEGSYAAALPVLRQAVASAPRTTLTYAYALFDLGRTLRLDGHPAAAIPILERRLRIPNQPWIVRQELLMAQKQAGVRADRSA